MIDSNKRPNLHTVTVDDPPFLFHCGDGYERHRLPVGTTVVYPSPPLKPLPDRRGAIIRAMQKVLDDLEYETNVSLEDINGIKEEMLESQRLRLESLFEYRLSVIRLQEILGTASFE